MNRLTPVVAFLRPYGYNAVMINEEHAAIYTRASPGASRVGHQGSSRFAGPSS